MLVPLTFRNKYGFPFQKDGADVLWAKAMGQKCFLHFEDGNELEWSYPLNAFHKKVYSTNLFRRVHDSFVIKISEAIGKKWLCALLSNDGVIPLSRRYNKKFQKYIDRNKSAGRK